MKSALSQAAKQEKSEDGESVADEQRRRNKELLSQRRPRRR
jgi:hypothetical protein